MFNRVVGGLIGTATTTKNGLMSASDYSNIPRAFGYNNSNNDIEDYPIGFSYIYNAKEGVFPNRNGCVLKFKYGGTSFYIGYFITGFYIRCFRDGDDTGWKQMTVS